MGHEPSRSEGERAAREALDVAKRELESRGIDWDFLAGKLREELGACETETFKGETVKISYVPTGKGGKKTKVVVRTEHVIYSKPLVAWQIRQKARMDAHTLRGDYPPEKKEISGPLGGAIPFPELLVRFVKPEDIKRKGGR